jgi:hypothetical protein
MYFFIDEMPEKIDEIQRNPLVYLLEGDEEVEEEERRAGCCVC